MARAVLAMLLATGLLVAASFLLGQALAFLCGWDLPRWWAPALGFAALLIIFGQAIRLPDHQTELLLLAVAGAVVSLALPAVRRALGETVVDAVGLGIGMILLAAIPFFAAGFAGILGTNVSNDMSQHLTGAYWLFHRDSMLPVAAIGGNLVNTGYPLGPHAMAAGIGHTLGIGEVRAFSAVTLAVPVLTGFMALGLVPSARRAARWALALVIGLGYLPAAYLAQGSFKETILAMLVLATAVTLQDLGAIDGRIGWRRPIPIALFVAGALYAYSYGALIWIGATIAFFFAAEVFRRRELFSVIRRWAPGGIAAIAVAVIVMLPEVHRVRAFRNSIFGQESLRNKGNLAHALNPFETLGVWFNGDFRFNPTPRWPTVLFCALALAALIAGLAWWWRRRALALPAAVLAGILVYVSLTQTVNIYNSAKGLIMLAPLVMACIGAPLATAWSSGPVRGHGRSAIWAMRGIGAVLFAGAVISSFAVLRSTPVGLGSHDAEFAAIRPLVHNKAVLFLDNDHFAEWELRGANPIYTTNLLYSPARLGEHPEKRGGLPVDVDNFGKGELDKVDFLLTAGGRYRSEIPPNFRLALRTPSYELYRRAGRTPTRQPLEPPGTPGAVLDCNSAQAKQYLKLYKWAGVLPPPVVSTAWRGSIARPGETARMRVKLPRGRWDVSIQYLSATPVKVHALGLTKTLAPNFGLISSFWPAGVVTSDGRELTLSATAGKRTWFGQLLGSPRAIRAPLSPGLRPLWNVAFTRHGETPRRVLAKDACGRYVDWFAPAGSRMRGRSGSSS